MKFILIILFVSFQSQASMQLAPKIIANHLASKLNKIENAFAQTTDTQHAPLLYQGSDETAYFLKRIRLQYSPFIAFDIGVFEAKIKPIFEFRWTRKNPKGWVNFKRDT